MTDMLDMEAIHSRVKTDYWQVPWPDGGQRQEDAETLLAEVERLRTENADLRAEHQSCLDGDNAWAEKWKAKYETAEAEIAALRQQLSEARYLAKVLVSAWDDDARPPADVAAKARTFAVIQGPRPRP